MLPVAALLPLLLFLLVAAATAQKETAAQDFTVRKLDGTPVRLSDYRGKVVLLNFWATWCPPCRKEIPHFVNLQEELKEKGLVVLGLSVDRGGVKAVRQWLRDHPVNYTMAMADGDVLNVYQDYLQPGERGAIPFSFIVDRGGNIRQRIVGYRDEDTWKSLVLPLLAEAGSD